MSRTPAPAMDTNPILMEALADFAHCEPADVAEYFDVLDKVTVQGFMTDAVVMT